MCPTKKRPVVIRPVLIMPVLIMPVLIGSEKCSITVFKSKNLLPPPSLPPSPFPPPPLPPPPSLPLPTLPPISPSHPTEREREAGRWRRGREKRTDTNE